MRRQYPNVVTFIMYGLLYDTMLNLWKPFSLKFLERLGGGEFHIALFNALPGLVAAAILLPGAVLLGRHAGSLAQKKRATAAFMLVSRAFLLAVACIPFLPPYVRPILFVILIAVMNCPDALSQTSLQSVLGTVFSGQTRAQAITLRNKFGNAVVPVVTIISGLVITFLPATDEQRMRLYQTFFAAAFLVGLAEVFVFGRFREEKSDIPQPAVPRVSFGDIKYVLKDRRFARFLWPVLIFTFFWQAGWPLCGIYQVQNLRANEMWFALFGLSSGIGAYVSAGWWQKYIKKHGNHKALVVAAFAIALNLVVFPISPNVYVLAVLSVFGGVAVIGINSSLFTGVLEATPDENRLVYLALYNTLANISLFIAPMASHQLLTRVGIFNAFYVVIALRALAGLLILVFGRPGGSSA
jgi:hypothetical protein